jgi:hypothetical protein
MLSDFLPQSAEDQDLDDLLLACVGDTSVEEMLLPQVLDEGPNQDSCIERWGGEDESSILCQRCKAAAPNLTNLSVDSLPPYRGHAFVQLWALVPNGTLQLRWVALEPTDWHRAPKGPQGHQAIPGSSNGRRKRRKARPRKKRLCLVCKTKDRTSDQALQCPGRWQRKQCPP